MRSTEQMQQQMQAGSDPASPAAALPLAPVHAAGMHRAAAELLATVGGAQTTDPAALQLLPAAGGGAQPTDPEDAAGEYCIRLVRADHGLSGVGSPHRQHTAEHGSMASHVACTLHDVHALPLLALAVLRAIRRELPLQACSSHTMCMCLCAPACCCPPNPCTRSLWLTRLSCPLPSSRTPWQPCLSLHRLSVMCRAPFWRCIR